MGAAEFGDAVGFCSVGASVARRVPPNNCFGCRPVRARAGPQRFVAVRGAATMVTPSFTGTVSGHGVSSLRNEGSSFGSGLGRRHDEIGRATGIITQRVMSTPLRYSTFSNELRQLATRRGTASPGTLSTTRCATAESGTAYCRCPVVPGPDMRMSPKVPPRQDRPELGCLDFNVRGYF